MHGSVLGWFVSALSRGEVESRDVLEVGSGNVNGSIRPLVEAKGPANYLGVDFEDGPGVDRVLDCTDLTAELGENCADVVVSTEMLEHVADWQASVDNLVRAVRPGGLLVITTRSVPFPYHGFPDDHWRYTPEAFARILDLYGLDPLIICTDPDPATPGVFVKARKPAGWRAPGLDFRLLLAGVEGVTVTVKPYTYLGLPFLNPASGFMPDGSSYYRMYLPFKHLVQSSGHQVYVSPPGSRIPLPEPKDLENVDLLVMQRPAGPTGLIYWNGWKRAGGTKLVYECDDDLLRVDPSGLPHLHSDDARTVIKKMVRLADLVTVSTPALAEAWSGLNGNIVVLPNYVNAELLQLERPRRDRLTVGWSGGTSHLVDWSAHHEAIGQGMAGADADLHFVGQDYSPMTPGVRTRFTQWEPNVWDYYKSIDFDIGVIPLARTDFTASKSHIKALEYAALGIPVVASDEPPYREFVIDGVTGFLVRTADEWRSRLRELINDADLRADMGAKAAAHAAQYTIQQHWPEWSGAYERVIENG